jgi:hypothetical protein
MTPMLRCTAVTSLRRTKPRNPPTINEFAISREGAGCHVPEVYHGYHLNLRLIEDKPHEKIHIAILYLLFWCKFWKLNFWQAGDTSNTTVFRVISYVRICNFASMHICMIFLPCPNLSGSCLQR